RRTGDWNRKRQAPSTSDHAGIASCKIHNIQTPHSVGVYPAKYRRESGAVSSGWPRIAVRRTRSRRREAVVGVVRGRLVGSRSPDPSRRQLRGSPIAERIGEIHHCPTTSAVLYEQSSASRPYHHNANIIRESMS